MDCTYKSASLGGLPDELTLLVLSNLHTIPSYEPQSEAFKNKHQERARQYENHVRKRALYSLALTNRRLNYVATPALYSSFVSTATSRGFFPVNNFHRTISTAPNLALHLKYVENRLAHYSGDSLDDDSAFSGTHALVSEYFFKLASIIALAPNLEALNVVSLEMRRVSMWAYLVPSSVLIPASNAIVQGSKIAGHGLEHLHSIALQIHTVDFVPGPEPFFRIADLLTPIPSLVQLRASGVISTRSMGPMSHTFKGLQRLEITECGLKFDDIADLLRACDGLRHFKCHWSFVDHGGDSPSELFEGIAPHASTLETLSLDMREARYHNSSASAINSHPHSLRDCSSLRTIEICERTVLPRSTSSDWVPANDPERISAILPPSLERLVVFLEPLEGYGHDHSPFDGNGIFYDLLEDCDLVLPKLRSVAIVSRGSVPAQHLTQTFCDRGVDLSFVNE